MKKNKLRQISINDISLALPDLKNTDKSKAAAISEWIINWIKSDLKTGKIKVHNLLPSKADFAFMLGVSIGTVQNALRFVEDAGYVESKQCIGTIVKDRNSVSDIRKLTSKREIAIEEIKKYLKREKFKVGQNLPSSRNIAQEINSSPNTTRLALENLCVEGILEHKFKNSNDAGWTVKSLDFTFNSDKEAQETLVRKVEEDLKNYITENLKIGDKLPPHGELAKKLNVSIKTIHDSIKLLIKEGILSSRRGRYGTIVAGDGEKTELYNYEKIELKIRQYIHDNCEVGAKLPTIAEFSEIFKMSQKTIKRALNNLSEDGYLTFVRGRYGGTFVTDIPQDVNEAYKWLALSSDYVSILEN